MSFQHDEIITARNDVWRVVGIGLERDGATFLHLASTTRFRQQRNGAVPVQTTGWFTPDGNEVEK
jgi:hypothetical protein